MIKFSISKEPAKHDEEGRPWYDTKEGIEKSLASLADLNRLLSARHVAGYQRDERMNEFFIFGRFSLDTCGNCGKAKGYVPKDEMPGMPDVMTRDEFWAYIKEHSGRGEDTMVNFSMGSEIPDENVLCPYCQKSWEAGNCHDTVPIRSTEVYPLDEFVGKTLGEVRATYAVKTDGTYFMQTDILVRNDKNIDLSPKYPDSEKEWERGVVVNEHGWLSERDGVTDEYVIQEGDEGFFNVWKYFHGNCHLKFVAEDPKFLGENGRFKNLAGAAYADVVIEKELQDAGIEIVKGDRTQSEVPFTLTGRLGGFTFARAWTYWTVACMMPLEVAKEMYENEIGAKFVRVDGHCGCPPPEEWALPCEEDLQKGLNALGVESATYGELAELLNSGQIDAPRFVQSYHIDTMPGLKLFAETVRQHDLA